MLPESVDPIRPLRDFVVAMTRLVDQSPEEPELLESGIKLLEELLREDSWLPETFGQPHVEHYRQYLLHCDPLERFSVVSFVWGPGQKTPIHDHTVWGLIGMLRGAEKSIPYKHAAGGVLQAGMATTLDQGAVCCVSPSFGDVHSVENALPDRPSISIHVYGANIGAVRRHVFDPHTGARTDFVSGYTSELVPNLWDRSGEIRMRAASFAP